MAKKNENPDPYLQMLDEWDDVQERLKALKAKELDLRKTLFAGAFPNPEEGTNTHVLPDGRKIKGKYPINRRIDEAALKPTLDKMREAGVANADQLVRYKPELAKREWNSLSDDMKLMFSDAVISSPGTPALEIVAAPRED